MKIIDFLEKHEIEYFDIDVKVVGKKKELQPYAFKNGKPIYPDQNDFENLSKEKLDKRKNSNYKYIAIDTRSIYHFDIDFEEDKYDEYCDDSKEWADMVKKHYPHYKSLSKPLGFHAFFTTDEEMPNRRPQTKFKDIEILSGQWAWASKDTEIINTKEDNDLGYPPVINEHLFEKQNQPKKKITFKKKTEKKDIVKNMDSGIEEVEIFEEDINQLSEILANIDTKYSDEYDSWTKIIWALRNNSKKNKGLAKRFSKRSFKYDEESFNKLWRNTRSGNSIATVYHYSKLSNPDRFNQIKSKYISIDNNLGTDDYLAKLFLEGSELYYVFKDNILYSYHNKIWSVDHNNNKLCNYIPKYLFDILNSKLTELGKRQNIANQNDDQSQIENLQNQRKNLNKIINNIHSVSKIQNIAKRIIHLLSCKDFDDIKFDEKANLFCFKNRTYDLEKREWIKPKREDYILTTTGYDYQESTEDDKKELISLIHQIFPDEDIKRTYVGFMISSLFGIPIEKFIIANGNGGNGKGVINELLVECLGEYAYNAPNEILLKPISGSNNPAVANMNNKRLIIYREPDSEYKKLCGSAIKELTGGSEIAARMNYSNNMKTQLKATHILECNKKPKIDGRIDDSYLRRLVDIPFKSTFTNNQELLDEGLDNVYKANSYYKSNNFKNKFKCVLFDYLIGEMGENPCDNIFEAEEVINRTREYLQDSDDLFGVISERIEKTGDKNDYIKMKDLYAIFQSSDYYSNLSKRQKREQNYKWLNNEIQSNVNFRTYYKNETKIDGKKIKSCLICYKIREAVVESGDELD